MGLGPVITLPAVYTWVSAEEDAVMYSPDSLQGLQTSPQLHSMLPKASHLQLPIFSGNYPLLKKTAMTEFPKLPEEGRLSDSVR